MIVRFNVINYWISEGVKNLFKNKKSTMSSLMIMCATMFIFGLFFVIGENVNAWVKSIADAQGIRVFIEVKGIENDVFYIKKKLFRAYLEKCKKEKGLNLLYFEIFTKRQLLQAIEIIKNYEFKD